MDNTILKDYYFYVNKITTCNLPTDFNQWDLYNEEGDSLAHFAAVCNALPKTFKQWNLKDHSGSTVAHVMAALGRLTEEVANKNNLWLLVNNGGITVAHVYLIYKPLPENFTQWDITDNTGWSIAHEAARCGRIPKNFTQWDLCDKEGCTVRDVCDNKTHTVSRIYSLKQKMYKIIDTRR